MRFTNSPCSAYVRRSISTLESRRTPSEVSYNSPPRTMIPPFIEQHACPLRFIKRLGILCHRMVARSSLNQCRVAHQPYPRTQPVQGAESLHCFNPTFEALHIHPRQAPHIYQYTRLKSPRAFEGPHLGKGEDARHGTTFVSDRGFERHVSSSACLCSEGCKGCLCGTSGKALYPKGITSGGWLRFEKRRAYDWLMWRDTCTVIQSSIGLQEAGPITIEASFLFGFFLCFFPWKIIQEAARGGLWRKSRVINKRDESSFYNEARRHFECMGLEKACQDS